MRYPLSNPGEEEIEEAEVQEVPQEAPEEIKIKPQIQTRPPGPTEDPVTLTCPHLARVDCIGNSGKLPGRVQTGTIAPGETMNPQGQDTTETSSQEQRLVMIEIMTNLTF